MHFSNRRQNYLLFSSFCLSIFVFVQFQRSENQLFFEVDEAQSVKLKPIKNSINETRCPCFSKSGKIFDFCYSLPQNVESRGKPFNCKFVDEWERIANLTKKFIDPSVENLPDPVFVTAFSAGFENHGKRLISSIRSFGFKQKIIIYNLGGIKEEELNILKNACNTEIRNFNFSKFPKYFGELKTYRWKPIVIAETLAEFGAIWYLDSSVSIQKSNLSHIYDLINCQRNVTKRPILLSSKARDYREKITAHESGWNLDEWIKNREECRKSNYLLHGYSSHGIYPATNPIVYQFFPTNFEEIRKEKAKMYDAGFVYALNTRTIMNKIIKWYVLCALEYNCMAPKNSLFSCLFGKDRFSSYANCHRFDQSIINLLLFNQNYYDRHYYVSEVVDFFNIDRSRPKKNFVFNLDCF